MPATHGLFPLVSDVRRSLVALVALVVRRRAEEDLIAGPREYAHIPVGPVVKENPPVRCIFIQLYRRRAVFHGYFFDTPYALRCCWVARGVEMTMPMAQPTSAAMPRATATAVGRAVPSTASKEYLPGPIAATVKATTR